MRFSAIACFFIIFVIASTKAELKCEYPPPKLPMEWIDISKSCTDKMREQIKTEIGASLQYLAMAAHFSKDKVNKPGFAKLFFEAAGEEREHAIKLISYLLMRGELRQNISNLIGDSLHIETMSWESGLSALKEALRLEATVTKSIRGVIDVCENDPKFNDYHLVDYLTGDFLEEQYKGQRDLASKVSILEKLSSKSKNLGEFLFDKKLLSNEV